MDTYIKIKLTIGLLFFLQTVTYVRGYRYTYIGCFRDRPGGGRALPAREKYYFQNSVDYCVTQCGSRGFRFAAVQFAFECWCGNSGYDRYGTSVGCQYPCTGDFSQTCGGKHINSVYEVVNPASTTTTITTSPKAINAYTTTSSRSSKASTIPLSTLAASSMVLGTEVTSSMDSSKSRVHGDINNSPNSEEQKNTTYQAYIITGIGAAVVCVIIALVVVLVVRRRDICYQRNNLRRDSQDDPYHPIPNRSEADHHNGENRSRFESTASSSSSQTSHDYEEIELPTISTSLVYVSQCFTITDESSQNHISEI